MTTRCPYCGKTIQVSASFCIYCGEPTDPDSISEIARRGEVLPATSGYIPESHTSQGNRFAWNELLTPGRRLEFMLGVAILVTVVAFGVYSAVQTNTLGSHYRAGMNAMAARDYDTARSELMASQGFQDANNRLKEVDATIQERDQLYSQALKASSQGKWWAAGNLLKQVGSIQNNYKDVPQLLQKAMGINGIVIYRLDRKVDGEGSIYVAQADGSEPRPIPHTDAQSQVHAVSSDGRWVIYSTYRPDIRTYYLYDVAARASRQIVLPATRGPTVITARFTADNARMWIVVDKSNYVIDVPASYEDGPLTPNSPTGVAAADQVHAPQIVIRKNPNQGTTTVSVAELSGLNEHVLATEAGAVDGAIFSKDRHYMLYRACASPNGGKSLTCVLHLLNMSSPFPGSTKLGTITLDTAEQVEPWALNGEFTRDGEHLDVITRKGDSGTLVVYRLNDADGNAVITKLAEWTNTDSAWELTEAPFIWAGIPGLQFWKGPNSQAYTTQTVILPEGTEDWAARAFGKSHWTSVSPGGKYAVYLVGRDIIASAGDYRLCASSLAAKPGTPEAASRVILIHTIRRPSEWLPFTYVLPDGQTLLSTMPPNSSAAPGLYSYDLATGEAKNDIPEVTDIWFPGFASLIPDIPVFTWHNE